MVTGIACMITGFVIPRMGTTPMIELAGLVLYGIGIASVAFSWDKLNKRVDALEYKTRKENSNGN